jgi:hypothetical protein
MSCGGIVLLSGHQTRGGGNLSGGPVTVLVPIVVLVLAVAADLIPAMVLVTYLPVFPLLTLRLLCLLKKCHYRVSDIFQLFPPPFALSTFL